MSEQTYAKLQEALSAHVLDENGEELSLVKDWVLVAGLTDVISAGTSEHVVVHRSEGTSLYTLAGLLSWGMDIMAPGDLDLD